MHSRASPKPAKQPKLIVTVARPANPADSVPRGLAGDETELFCNRISHSARVHAGAPTNTQHEVGFPDVMVRPSMSTVEALIIRDLAPSTLPCGVGIPTALRSSASSKGPRDAALSRHGWWLRAHPWRRGTCGHPSPQATQYG